MSRLELTVALASGSFGPWPLAAEFAVAPWRCQWRWLMHWQWISRALAVASGVGRWSLSPLAVSRCAAVVELAVALTVALTFSGSPARHAVLVSCLGVDRNSILD